jgi:RNA polymerase sigma-70 factor (ECF subfamily)
MTPGFIGDDRGLVAGLKQGQVAAQAALFDRYSAYVERVLLRVLGPDSELADVLHDTFLQAFASISKLKDPESLRLWLASVAVFTAMACLRKRKRRSWLKLRPDAELSHASGPSIDEDAFMAVRCTYQLLAKLPVDERAVFSLRHLEGMALEELAQACRISLSTAKRRLARAEGRFDKLAEGQPMLARFRSVGRQAANRGSAS